MEIKLNAMCALLAAGMLAVTNAPSQAQNQPLSASKNVPGIVTTPGKDIPVRRETLSGIDLYPEGKKNDSFMLSFQQNMTEAGVLELTNYAGKVLYTKPIPVGDHTLAPPVSLGKLKTGTYLVEVKTPTTVYWKKMRVRMR